MSLREISNITDNGNRPQQPTNCMDIATSDFSQQRRDRQYIRHHHQRREHPEIFRMNSTESLGLSLEPPHFISFRGLIYALLLSTFLAVCAAFDAKMKCVDHENAAYFRFEGEEEGYIANYDDDTINLIMKECRDTFRLVILPVAGTTFFFGLISVLIVQLHIQRVECSHNSLIPSHLSALLKVFLPLLCVGVAWSYGVYAIMLKPKLQDAWDAELNNPFQSLAAVTIDGHIGGNANLYYLCWTSEILIMVLLYQVGVDSFRWVHKGFSPQERSDNTIIQPTPSFHDQIHAMLSSTSVSRVASFYRQRRKTWYQFLIRLRERSGYWVVAFFASLLVFASSGFLFVQVLINLAVDIQGSSDFKYREVCAILEGNEEFPEQYCLRTVFATLSGAIATAISIFGIILHLIFRRGSVSDSAQTCGELEVAIHAVAMLQPVSSNISLKIEFFLSLIPTLLLGLNAIFATGVQGPASEVGNLYYASFVSFFFILRICLGCIEELRSIEANAHETADGLVAHSIVEGGSISDSQSSMASNSSGCYDPYAMKERRGRLRRFLFLAILSALCSASAWDAAVNQDDYETSRRQKYVIYAPAVVALISTILFAMCLHTSSYAITTQLWCGGVLSVALFVVWLADLIVTMHSEDSWAVNEIGEIQMANLYYFSWGSIIVAGMQMASYAKPILGHHDESDLFVLWAANIKVCMVTLGASLHIWHTISSSCAATDVEDTLEELSETFCGRTKLGIAVALTGILSGWLCTISRVLGCPITKRYTTRVETFLSVFLIIVYGAGVALLTGMGGPGQSVGDLFYASWLSFVVSVAIFVTSIDQLQKQEIAESVAEIYIKEEPERYITCEEDADSAMV
ncbi:hypothetical protein IV203_036277 [Nitzschia inconspicua]|uniref:Uncharacterized protein n=1 Tax=Nitzschia inconspicua TaxID=303405 RepID=A0A9K3LFJ1_9STRA|nr:hypothetical protein IV203_036277 [Nitzschia inconspicua]